MRTFISDLHNDICFKNTGLLPSYCQSNVPQTEITFYEGLPIIVTPLIIKVSDNRICR